MSEELILFLRSKKEFKNYIKDLEIKLIEEVLVMAKHNQSAAADILKLNRTTMIEKLRPKDKYIEGDNIPF